MFHMTFISSLGPTLKIGKNQATHVGDPAELSVPASLSRHHLLSVIGCPRLAVVAVSDLGIDIATLASSFSAYQNHLSQGIFIGS
jgi:hypothetical protein